MSSSVFILGAGASKAAGAPIMAEFLDVAQNLLNRSDGVADKSDFEKVFEAIGTLQSAQAKSKLNLTNIESVLSAFEMARILGRMGDAKSEGIEDLAKSVRKVIVRTLEETMAFPFRKDGILPPQGYDQFAELIGYLRMEADPKHSVSVITFNYDIGLDYALHYKGINATYSLDKDGADYNGLPLLKLHGSINWAYCPTCSKVLPLTMKDYYQRFPHGHVISTPDHLNIRISDALHSLNHANDHPYDPMSLIVPPAINKTDYYQSMHMVWKRAAHELSEAENIFISGYSLPETDIFFRYLFSLGTIGKKPLRKIWVFDIDDSGDIEKRFRGLLGTGALERFKYFKAKFIELPEIIKKEFKS